MSRTLYLLRHANALAGSSEFDIDRPLSEEGLAQCARLSSHIGDLTFARILCSPARRTLETLHKVVKQPRGDVKDEFYNATQVTLLRAIQATDDSFTSLLIVAHNPGISDLARTLGLPSVKTFPPCAFASFSVAGSWQGIDAATCKALDFYCP
jgi:phosphohistidine phosphatase